MGMLSTFLLLLSFSSIFSMRRRLNSSFLCSSSKTSKQVSSILYLLQLRSQLLDRCSLMILSSLNNSLLSQVRLRRIESKCFSIQLKLGESERSCSMTDKSCSLQQSSDPAQVGLPLSTLSRTRIKQAVSQAKGAQEARTAQLSIFSLSGGSAKILTPTTVRRSFDSALVIFLAVERLASWKGWLLLSGVQRILESLMSRCTIDWLASCLQLLMSIFQRVTISGSFQWYFASWRYLTISRRLVSQFLKIITMVLVLFLLMMKQSMRGLIERSSLQIQIQQIARFRLLSLQLLNGYDFSLRLCRLEVVIGWQICEGEGLKGSIMGLIR